MDRVEITQRKIRVFGTVHLSRAKDSQTCYGRLR